MRFFSLLLCSLMLLNPVWAQTGPVVSSESNPEAVLHVRIVDDPGPSATHSTSAKGYVVQVTDTSGAPVSGAAVALSLPEEGATGRFANGLRAWVVYTDAAGIARFPVIQWGEHAGPLKLRLTAAKGASHSGLTVAQQLGLENSSVSAVPKPAIPSAPEVALETAEPGAISKPLADAIPPTVNAPAIGSPSEKPHTLVPNPPAAAGKDGTEPTVTISNSPTGAGGGGHESHKKLWALVAVGTGAGVATLLALRGHLGGGGGGSSASSTGVSVGAPTITVGH